MRVAFLRKRCRARRWVADCGQRVKRVVWVMGRFRDCWVRV